MAQVHKRRKDLVIEKKDGDFIKRQDRRENVERINRIQQHQRDLLLLKINKEEGRMHSIKADKEELLQVRRKMQAEVQQNRKDMEAKLALMRSGKLSAQQLLREANILKTEESVHDRSEAGFIT